MKANKLLVEHLIQTEVLKSPNIIESFLKIDRINFVLPQHQTSAYLDMPLHIGFEQTISQPTTVAFMLELLNPKKEEKILDIGSGSGWTSSLLAFLVSDKNIGKYKQPLIFSIERIPQLYKMAQKNINKYGFIDKNIVKIKLADGSKGWTSFAPFDKIIAGAMAQKIPSSFKKQLKTGGRLVMPIGNSIIVLDKISENEFKTQEYFGFSFVPLIET